MDPTLLRDIVVQVSAARRLPERRKVRIDQVGRARFLELLSEHAPKPGESDDKLSATGGFLIGFNLLPPPGKRETISSAREVLEEQVAGFYDRRRDIIVVPMRAPVAEDEQLKHYAIIAHEVQHALQAQHFDTKRLDGAEDDDIALARLALVEGDAQVAMGAYLGARYGAPIGRTLRAITDVTKTVSVDEVAHGEGKDKKLAGALPIARQRLEFPYLEGMRFVADIFRAGGFDLVNKLYERPPASTEQILHPMKYIAGEAPVPVREPEPPKGYRRVTAGKLGELQARVLLSQCAPADAEQAAAGWGGDAYLVAAQEQGKGLALLWSSVWDSDADATEVEKALTRDAACWHENASDESDAAYTIGKGHRVERSGKRIAFVRGIEGKDAAVIARGLLGLVGEPPAPESLGDFAIPERAPLPERRAGKIRKRRYRSEWLGIRGRIPPGMAASIKDQAELLVQRSDVLVYGGLFLSDRITNGRFVELAFQEIGDGFAKGLPNFSIQPLASGKTRVPLGAAMERTWQVVGTMAHMRAIMVPICAGTGSLIFIQAYQDLHARRVLDAWIDSFEWIDSRNVPACDRLDPK